MEDGRRQRREKTKVRREKKKETEIEMIGGPHHHVSSMSAPSGQCVSHVIKTAHQNNLMAKYERF